VLARISPVHAARPPGLLTRGGERRAACRRAYRAPAVRPISSMMSLSRTRSPFTIAPCVIPRAL